MATIPAAAYFNAAARTEGEFKQALEDFLASVKQIPGAGVAELTITIASGSVTPAGSGNSIILDTEAAAATDDLTNVVTTNYPIGSMIMLRNSNAARLVVVKHLSGGAGQMNLDLNGEYTLDDTEKYLVLQRRNADWYEVSRGPQRPSPVESPIINGAFEIWQRNTAFTSPTTGTYTADRWLVNYISSTGTFNVNRYTTVPTVAQAGVLFKAALEIDITALDSTIASTEYLYLSTRIEGYNWRHFAQRQFTLSFWVSSTMTGTHCVAFRNNASGTADQAYIGTYSIAVANTWEYKTITVTPSPSGGTWFYDHQGGLEVAFALAVGSNFHGTAGVWNASNALGTSGQANCLSSASNFFRLTGVRMEAGPLATPYTYVSYERELERCHRYYQKSFAYATAPAQNVGNNTGEYCFMLPGAATVVQGIPVEFNIPMRSTPTITVYNPAAANAQIRNTGTATDFTGTAVHQPHERGFLVYGTAPAASVAGHIGSIHYQAVAEL